MMAHASLEDISSYSEDETTQPPSQKDVKHESGKSPVERNELRAIHNTSSKAQTGANRPNTILFNKGMTDPNEYSKDTDYSAISEKRMDANLAPKKDNNANVKIKENEIQRTLSRTIELPQQESDDPWRGGRVSSDAEEPGSADVSEISNNHEQDDITEEKIPGDAIHTSTGRLKSAEDAVVTVIRDLSKKGYDFYQISSKRIIEKKTLR